MPNITKVKGKLLADKIIKQDGDGHKYIKFSANRNTKIIARLKDKDTKIRVKES